MRRQTTSTTARRGGLRTGRWTAPGRHRRWLPLAVAFGLAAFIPGGVAGQMHHQHGGAEGEAAVAAVQALFDAMAARDAEAIRGLLTDGAVFASAMEAPDGVQVRETAGSDFAAQIGQAGPALLERMWEPHVMVDGPLAMVWTPYDFHVDGEFSHCGIDIVSLVKADGAWKISSIAYTMQRDDCTPSPLGPPGS